MPHFWEVPHRAKLRVSRGRYPARARRDIGTPQARTPDHGRREREGILDDPIRRFVARTRTA